LRRRGRCRSAPTRSPSVEKRRPRGSAIGPVGRNDDVPAEDVDAAVEHLRKQARHLYVRLDLGALDPAVVRRSWTHHCQAGSSRHQFDRFSLAFVSVSRWTPRRSRPTHPPRIQGRHRQLTSTRSSTSLQRTQPDPPDRIPTPDLYPRLGATATPSLSRPHAGARPSTAPIIAERLSLSTSSSFPNLLHDVQKYCSSGPRMHRSHGCCPIWPARPTRGSRFPVPMRRASERSSSATSARALRPERHGQASPAGLPCARGALMARRTTTGLPTERERSAGEGLAASDIVARAQKRKSRNARSR
jgi:hypothetical protein